MAGFHPTRVFHIDDDQSVVFMENGVSGNNLDRKESVLGSLDRREAGWTAKGTLASTVFPHPVHAHRRES